MQIPRLASNSSTRPDSWSCCANGRDGASLHLRGVLLLLPASEVV